MTINLLNPASAKRQRQPLRLLLRAGWFLAGLAMLATSSTAVGQSTDERFQDLFETAGYCTAFGAAIGTAFLAWTDDPTEHLEYVAMGASLGFLGGSVLGTYMIFSPVIVDGESQTDDSLIAENKKLPSKGFVFRPTWDRKNQRIAGVQGGMTLLNF